MKIIISETQYLRLMEGNQVIDTILDKISSGDKLMIDEKKCLDAYSEYLKKGGYPEDFKCPELEYDEREGKVFVSNFKGLPEIKFTFSEELNQGDEIQYFGEIQFDGEEYLGVIITDGRGFLTDYDFYNVSDELNDYSFNDVIEGIKHEVGVFFQDEVIPELRR
jgi:hypothetical protein